MAEKKKEAEKKVERIYIIPLSKAYDKTRTKRTNYAVKMVRSYLSRHFKTDEKNVKLSEGVNSYLWRDSIQKPPRKIKIRAVKTDDSVKGWLIGEEEKIKKQKEEKKKKEDAKKPKESKPAVKKEVKTVKEKPKETVVKKAEENKPVVKKEVKNENDKKVETKK